MEFGTPQIIMAILSFMDLGIYIGKHGQPREPYNFFYGLLNFLALWTLLIWGGFFR